MVRWPYTEGASMKNPTCGTVIKMWKEQQQEQKRQWQNEEQQRQRRV
jgi:hypothetical protein